MSEIKNVTVVGAAGALGTPVLKALIDSQKFTATVITRASSNSTFPASVKVIHADFTSLASLTSALRGQDAVISTVGTEGLLGQSVLIDAAIAAGVKRFLPSEFGANTSNPLNAALPIFGHKVATRKHLEAAVGKQEGEKITYTYVHTGPFLDWGLEKNFIINLKETPVKLYDNGSTPFSTTTLASIGKAVVGILSHPEETKNRAVFVEDLQISQKRILELAEKITGKKYKTVNVDTAALKKGNDEALAKGEVTPMTIFSYLFPSVFGGEKYGNPWGQTDNKLLGLEGKGEEAVEEYLKEVLA